MIKTKPPCCLVRIMMDNVCHPLEAIKIQQSSTDVNKTATAWTNHTNSPNSPTRSSHTVADKGIQFRHPVTLIGGKYANRQNQNSSLQRPPNPPERPGQAFRNLQTFNIPNVETCGKHSKSPKRSKNLQTFENATCPEHPITYLGRDAYLAYACWGKRYKKIYTSCNAFRMIRTSFIKQIQGFI